MTQTDAYSDTRRLLDNNGGKPSCRIIRIRRRDPCPVCPPGACSSCLEDVGCGPHGRFAREPRVVASASCGCDGMLYCMEFLEPGAGIACELLLTVPTAEPPFFQRNWVNKAPIPLELTTTSLSTNL